MIGLLLLGTIAVWAVLGFVLWKWLLKPRFETRASLAVATLVAAAFWFIGPVLDEILGAQTFKQLCDEMPPIEFYGPVAVGPGSFFDEKGDRRWTSEDEFYSIKRNAKEWERIFGEKSEDRTLARWPIPVFEGKTTYYERASGRPSVVSSYRGSPGGWIKRSTGLGRNMGYQCPPKGTFPRDTERLAFKADSASSR